MARRWSIAGQLLALQLGIIAVVLVGVGAVTLAQAEIDFRSTATGRVRSVADCLGNHAMPVEVDAAVETVAVQFVARACPVAQRQMDAGSIELY